jgi:hypothetical protein
MFYPPFLAALSRRSTSSEEIVRELMVSMWLSLAVGADEGYGPTWDSDDEYDNFIRKMNPPRCVRSLANSSHAARRRLSSPATRISPPLQSVLKKSHVS